MARLQEAQNRTSSGTGRSQAAQVAGQTSSSDLASSVASGMRGYRPLPAEVSELLWRRTTMTKRSMISVIGVAGSMVAAPAAAQPRMPQYVACVGDSITAGTGASTPDMAYPADLRALFGGAAVVINYGHSGATMLSTGDLPYMNQPEYAAANSYLMGTAAGSIVDVIIMLGTNDSKAYNWAPGGASMATQFATDAGALALMLALAVVSRARRRVTASSRTPARSRR